MQHQLYKRVIGILAALLLIALSAAAQSEEKFKIRISPVPLDGAMRATVAGSGSGTATLSGSKLTIAGTFDGMPSAATTAKIHRGLATGVRGSPFLDLTVTKAPKGTVSGSFDLTPEQVQYLKQGKLYIQIQSEKAPEGTLWGWILKL
ncbi:MAG TPA: CHRD domain-containing protein [Terriglobia bacterium]|nr:CHRD domain-containing protein [Terriglobia bacterium]